MLHMGNSAFAEMGRAVGDHRYVIPITAEDDEEAAYRATSMQQAFVNLRSGRPGRLPPPRRGYYDQVGPQERALLDSV